MKNNKAPGYDGLVGEFFKYSVDELHNPLYILFNYIFDTGQYPKILAEGIIHPVHKKGSQNETDNYRKITVMSVLGKIFESIVNNRLK